LTLTVEEAAAALGISRAAYEDARRGEIPNIRIGRRILVPRSALQRLLDSATATPHDKLATLRVIEL
jgi:excisionase family DNA binding protein